MLKKPISPNFDHSNIFLTDNFRALSSQGHFEGNVINLTETTVVAVILAFITLSGTSPQI